MSQSVFTRSQVDHFAQSLTVFTDAVNAINVANGWHDDHRRFGEDIALLHSEVSEMLEAFRDHSLDDVVQITHEDRTFKVLAASTPALDYAAHGVIPKPVSVGSEAADVLIRLLDTCSRYGIDLAAETARKLDFNKTRGYKHGGKAL